MSQNHSLVFLSLRLKNYRQYFGDQKISLAPKDGKLINIFQGENGEGKSNILNAMNYCLYQEEPHLKTEVQTMPIVNTRAIDNTGIGEEVEMIVELEIGNEDIKYKIARKVSFFKPELIKEKDEKGRETIKVFRKGKLGYFPIGSNPLEQSSFQWSRGRDWKTEPNIESHINQLLPKNLRSFYFLDGDFLESLATTFQGVKEGVEEISHLTLVFNALGSIKKIITDYERQTKGTDTTTDEILKEKENHERWLESTDVQGNVILDKENPGIKIDEKAPVWYLPRTGRPRERAKKKELEFLKKKIREIDEQLQKQNSGVSKEWMINLKKLEKKLPKKYDELKCLKESKLKYLVQEGPFAYLHSSVKYASDLIDKHRKGGQLPVKYNDIFVKDLLDEKECICGARLEDSSVRKNILEWQKKSSKDPKLDVCVEIGVDFKNKLKNFKDEFSQLDKFRTDIIELEEEINEDEDSAKEYRTKLKGINEDHIDELFREKEAKENLRDEINEELAQLKVTIRRHEQEANIKQTEYNKAIKANSKLIEASRRLSVSRILLNSFRDIRTKIITKFSEQIETDTKNYFMKLIWKKDTFKDVILGEDYHLSVIHKDGYNAISHLSAGEKLILALSFVAAVRKITGYQFPLVIDTPLGKISGSPKTHLGKLYPKFLDKTQLTLLVTDTEYQSPIKDQTEEEYHDSIRKLINEFVNVEYKLKYNEELSQTTVGDL